MTIATGVAKQVAYKAETTWATAPSAGSAQLLRRVTCVMDQTKSTYKSMEIAPTYQVPDFRHGVKKAMGNLKGELSPGAYPDFMAAALRRAFTALTASTGLTITIAGTGPYTVTRSAGSWLTDGVKAGMVGRLSGGSFTAINMNNNLFIISVTATVLTVVALNSSTLVAEGPIASSTFTMIGKQTFPPITGQLDNSFTIEERFPDVNLYERFVGCKVDKVSIAMPTTGNLSVDIGFMGQQRDLRGTSAYFTSPTAATTIGVLNSGLGKLYVNGSAVATITAANINITGNYTSPNGVVGSNVIPAIFPGRVEVAGDFSAYFDAGTYRDAFDDETTLSASIVIPTGTSNTADFIGITIPLFKFSGATRTDGEIGIEQKLPFQAYYNAAGGAGTSSEQTTLLIQDSQA